MGRLPFSFRPTVASRRAFTNNVHMIRVAIIAVLAVSGASFAQLSEPFEPRGAIRTPEQAAQAKSGAELRELKRALGGVRYRHFDGAKPDGVAQAGVAELERTLKASANPRKYAVALDVFRRSDARARSALLEVMAQDGSDGALGALAFLSCREDEAYGERATALLIERAETARKSPSVLWVVQRMLAQPHVPTASRAAGLVDAIDLIDAVPMLIVTQTFSHDDGRSQSLGTAEDIQVKEDAVERELWFGIRLAPPVYETLEGRSGIIDYERVYTSPRMPRDYSKRASHQQTDFYRGEVHDALIEVTTRAWGQSTEYLGWDVELWKKWYIEEFQPAMLAKRAVEQAPPVQTPAQP